MARIPNPYIVGTPIPSAEFFYGRQPLLSFVRDTLNPPQQRVVVLYGQRRIGKTSVLYELARRLSGEYHPIYFDLMGQANRPLSQALHEIAVHIADSLELDPPQPFREPLDFRAFLETACSLLPADEPLLLLLDEFDDLSEQEVRSDAAAHTLFDYLRDLLNIQLPIAFVFVVGRRLTELPQNFQSILKQAPSRRVAFLDEKGAKALITQPAAGILSYTTEAVQAIYGLTSGHPYFTQLICFELFRLGINRENTRITADDVEMVLDSAMETGKGGLAWFWDALPMAERFVMSAIAEISRPYQPASTEAVRQLLANYDLRFLGLEVTDAPNLLVQWQILDENDLGYQFVVDLVRRWVATEHPLTRAKREIENLVPRANRYFANAREAHQAGEITLAISDYRQTLRANPHHLRAQLGLAQALEEKGDLLAANQAYRDAYALDQASVRDGLVKSLEKLAALDEQNNALPEAIQKLENAQEILESRERQAQIEALKKTLAAQQARRALRLRRLRYGMGAAGMIIALVLTIVFFGPQILDFISGITGLQSTGSNELGISPAQAGEPLILFATFEGTETAGLDPQGSLKHALAEAFPGFRVEALDMIVSSHSPESEAADVVRSVGAAGLLHGWVAQDSIGTGIVLVNPESDESIALDLGEYRNMSFTDLTGADVSENYPRQIISELESLGLVDVALSIGAVEGTVAPSYVLGRSLLLYAQVHPEQSDTYVNWAEDLFEKSIDHAFFEPLILPDNQGRPIAYVPSGHFERGRSAAEMNELCRQYATTCAEWQFVASEPTAGVYTNGYFIDVVEVTNEAYLLCVEQGACEPPQQFNSISREAYFGNPTFANYPVIAVSWEQAATYCQWRGGRLPTDAQWEKAARWHPVEETRVYPWGDQTPDASMANFGPEPGDTMEVGRFPDSASPIGALDMTGNVWEWSADWFQADYYKEEDLDNPQGPPFGDTRVIRGGSFGGPETNIVDPAFRGEHDPGANPFTGFRCAFENPFR